MLWFKSCPRCVDGDLVLDAKLDAWCVSCLQCGYTKNVEDPIRMAISATSVEQMPFPTRR